MKILVIALHKLGDNLQVTPVFRVLQNRHPKAQVSVLTEPKFRFAFDNHPCINAVHLFDRTKYSKHAVASLDQGEREMCGTLKSLRAEGFDLVVNRQSSVEGAVIASLIHPKKYTGIYMKPDNRVAIEDPWTRLLFSACSNRYVNPFNFVDYGINAAGNGAGERRLELHADPLPGEALLSGLGLTGGPLVALQPGSASPMRRWPTSHFADMAVRLLARIPGATCLVMGSPAEAPLAAEILARAPGVAGKRLLDLTSDLPLTALPGMLSRCSLLVTNDTGPMHVAAAVGCPVIALYFGESFVHETGPYGENHHVLHARLDCLPCTFDKPCKRAYACQQQLPPSAVAEMARSSLTGTAPDASLLTDIAVYKSGRGEGGPDSELRYRPVFRMPARETDVHRALYYPLFRSHLHNVPFSIESAARELAADYTDAAGCVNRLADLDISLITQFAKDDAEAVMLRERLRDGLLELRRLMN